MNESIPYADIVILALIAGFILLRLRSVLGQKTGMDESKFLQRVLPPADTRQEPIVQITEKSMKPKNKEENDPVLAAITDSSTSETITAIKLKDPQYTATSFLEGARMAFEMVFDAFAKGDKATLKLLLASDLADDFSNEIDARDKEITKSETTLVAIPAKAITHAALTGNMARITVEFTSEQITVVRDKDGKIVEGDPSVIHEVEDKWVFERDVSSKNPNWKIIET